MAAVALAGSTSAQAAGPGGVGDPFFPLAGNLGYQVLHYDLRLAYAPKSGHLQGDARIRARARRRLRSFHLDFRHLTVRRVRVNGDPARFRRSGQELIIAPRRALRGRRPFSVRVEYAGTPRPLRDADGAREGWIRTSDGAFVVAEPRGAPTWFPCNDHPRDKATYRFALTVPRRLHAVANGRLRSMRRGARTRTWVWRARQPMASYLAMVDIGLGAVRRSRVAGVPSWITVDPFYGAGARPLERKLRRVMSFLQRYFGPYPFEATGAVVDRAGIGYALESQTRPFFDGQPTIYTLVHEIAHQWFGNSVTLRAWPQIWLNEGFATWAELFWQERHGGPSVRTAFRRLYRTPASDRAFWNPPPGRLGGPDLLFDQTVYMRGAMALQALRQKVGNVMFFGILRAWARENRHGHGTIRSFIALAERRARTELGRLFRVWLFTPGKPGRRAARR